MERTYEVVEIQKRADIILDFSEKLIDKSEELNNKELLEQAKELLKIIENEYKKHSNIILDYIKNRESKGIVNLRYDTYKTTYESAKELLEKWE